MSCLFEFRIFGKDLSHIEEKIKKSGSLKKYKEVFDTYIVSENNHTNNIKIRNKNIKIKCLIKEEKGLELWQNKYRFSFPVKTDLLKEIVFPALKLECPRTKEKTYSYESFLEKLIIPYKEAKLVYVSKKRTLYELKGCTVDAADLFINGIEYRSISINDFEIDPILKVIKILDLSEYENKNYIKAIKELIMIL